MRIFFSLLAILFISWSAIHPMYGQQLKRIEIAETDLQSAVNIDDSIKAINLLIELYAEKDTLKARSYIVMGEQLVDELSNQDYKAGWLIARAIYEENQFRFDKAALIYGEVEQIYRETDNLKGLGKLQNLRGRKYILEGKIDSSLIFFMNALAYLEPLGENMELAYTYGEVGYAHYRLTNYDSALHYYFKALRYCDAHPEYNCFDTYNEMGTIYGEINEPEKAIEYHTLAMNMAASQVDSINMAISYINIAGMHYGQQEMDSAMFYLSKAVDIYEYTGSPRDRIIAQNNLGVLYNQKGRYDDAIKIIRSVIPVARAINDESNRLIAYLNLGEVYTNNQQYQLAALYLDSGFQLASAYQSKYFLSNYYRIATLLYSRTNRYPEALEAQKTHFMYEDSIVNEQKNKQIAELNTQYETEKKEQEIALQASIIKQNELSLQRNQALIIALVILLLALLVIGLFYYKRQQYRQQLLLEAERHQLKADQIKAVIQSQEEERKRFAMDLHDDFGQMISALRIQSNHKEVGPSIRDNMNGQLDQMYKSLKTIAFNLMPQTLLDRGLVDALDELCLQLTSMSDMVFQFHAFEAEEHLDDDQKVAVYRIIQEVVNNIIKYAHASKVTINLTGHQDALSVMIEDDGYGFDVATFKSGKGNGWKNIQSRLELLNGEITYDTAPSRKSSTVIVDVPLRMTAAEAA